MLSIKSPVIMSDVAARVVGSTAAAGILRIFNRQSGSLCCCNDNRPDTDRADEKRAEAGLAGVADPARIRARWARWRGPDLERPPLPVGSAEASADIPPEAA
jgi:hypothetical protein